MSTEKRRHERLAFQGTIFIELLARGMGGNDGEVLVCKTINISHGGLRVGVKRELTVGAILQIGVDLSSAQDTLYLAGEVIWCRKDAIARNDRKQLFLAALPVVVALDAWRVLVGVGGKEAQKPANGFESLGFVLDHVVYGATPLVDLRAAEFLLGHALPGGALHDGRARDEQLGRVSRHDREV